MEALDNVMNAAVQRRWIPLPEYWRRLSLDGKRRWLIERRFARDWSEASAVLARFRRKRGKLKIDD
jgi:hypothetical protein